MNLTHLHLILNHIPVVGSLCGLGLLAFALIADPKLFTGGEESPVLLPADNCE